MANFKAVGRISGNALNGLCDRMCISVECVIDGCQSRRLSQTATVELTDITTGAEPPFTFVRAEDDGGSSFQVQSSCVNGNNCRNVTGTLNVPITVVFTDARGVCCQGRGNIILTRQLALKVPSNPGAPYAFIGDGAVICFNGTFLSDSVVSLTYCIVETYKTVINADILVPTYGFAVYPECRDCSGCDALMNSPLFDENET